MKPNGYVSQVSCKTDRALSGDASFYSPIRILLEIAYEYGATRIPFKRLYPRAVLYKNIASLSVYYKRQHLTPMRSSWSYNIFYNNQYFICWWECLT